MTAKVLTTLFRKDRWRHVALSVMMILCTSFATNIPAQTDDSHEEMMRQVQLMELLHQGTFSGPQLIGDLDRDQVGITHEQVATMFRKTMEAIRPFEEELRKKFGRGPGDLKREQLVDLTEALTAMMPKANEISRKVMKETFSAETIRKIDVHAFQKFGGVFGGALNVENLAALDLTDEQKAKAAKIVDKLNRERFELEFSAEIDRKPGEEADFAKIKENMEKMISLTRQGQREIEALLTVEQKRKAEELMANVPENYRFISDYLKNRPWRLDESNWKPGDGAPKDLENHPGELRPQRPRGERVFPEN